MSHEFNVDFEARTPEQIPRKAHPDDAAWDLLADIPKGGTLIIPPGETRIIPTGIKLGLVAPQYALVLPRSGLAMNGLTVANAPGLIDAGYRGEVKVILNNFSKTTTHTIRAGDRIAQLMVLRQAQPNLICVPELTDDTVRGDGGFGSSGITAAELLNRQTMKDNPTALYVKEFLTENYGAPTTMVMFLDLEAKGLFAVPSEVYELSNGSVYSPFTGRKLRLEH